MATLSLCMIARNEAGNIGRCLNSVKDFVDEIILVDTGSTDNTVEIARALGAKIIEERWRDDFSAARNSSLQHANGDWILFLDGDEELVAESGPKLRRVIEDGRYEAYFVLVTNTVETGAELTFPSIRLFRNRPSYRFTGRIHEQIVDSIIKRSGLESIGRTDISVMHHGYDPGLANIQAKIQRNLAILEAYPPEKRDGFYLYNLGTEYLRLGEKKKALACYLEALKLTSPGQAFGPILVKRTMTVLMDLERYRVAVEQLRYYQTIYTEFSDLVYLEVVCHLKCGRYSEARASLERYMQMPPPPAWYSTEWSYHQTLLPGLTESLQALAVDKSRPGISVCIIGRDESAHIRQCLQSVNEIAREVIYVDTGSNDNTPAVAFQMGARVYHRPWNNDYGQARNFALDQAGGEWILVLDADEALPDGSRESIAGLVESGRHDGYVFKICTYLDRGMSPADCHVGRSCRLWRNKGQRFRGAAAEEIVPAILASGGTVAPAEVTVNHLHFLAEESHLARKRAWKEQAIRTGLAGEPRKRDYALGLECFYARDFASAVAHFERSLSEAERAGAPEYFYFFGLSLLNAGDPGRAADLLARGTEMFQDYTDLFYLRAVAHFLLGNMAEAEMLLHRCLAMGDAPWEKYVVSPGTGSFKAMCSLGALYARKGNVARAVEILVEAASFPGAFTQAVEGLTFMHRQLPQPLPRFLESHNLLTARSLAVASGCLAQMGQWEESLAYLRLACDLQAREPAPRDFAPVTRCIDALLEGYLREAVRALPEDSPVKRLSIS